MTSTCRTCGLTFETTAFEDDHLLVTLTVDWNEGHRPAKSHIIDSPLPETTDTLIRQATRERRLTP